MDKSSAIPEHLAGGLLNRHSESPGINYARHGASIRESKKEERQAVLEFFAPIERDHGQTTTILTFPALNWHFEGRLIHMYCGDGGWQRQHYKVGRHIQLVGIEQEVEIYRASLHHIPGIKHGVKTKPCPPYALYSCRTYAVKRYLCTRFEDLAVSKTGCDDKDLKFDMAWLDFNGNPTNSRLTSICAFISNHMKNPAKLVVTVSLGHSQTSREAATLAFSEMGTCQWALNRPRMLTVALVTKASGCGPAAGHLAWDQEVGGSTPPTPTEWVNRGCHAHRGLDGVARVFAPALLTFYSTLV